MSVKAKFKCDSITQWTGQREAKLSPVHSSSDENKQWSQFTPSGQLTMTITNPEAYEQFEVGVEYYLTIEKAN